MNWETYESKARELIGYFRDGKITTEQYSEAMLSLYRIFDKTIKDEMALRRLEETGYSVREKNG